MVKMQKESMARLSLKKAGDFLNHIEGSMVWNTSQMEALRQEISRRMSAGERIDPRLIPSMKFDADLSAVALQNGIVFQDDDSNVLFYGCEEKVLPNGRTVKYIPGDAMYHSGDVVINGEDAKAVGGEKIDFFLERFHPEVDEVAIVATIHKASARNHTWSLMDAKFILTNLDTGEIIESYDFGNDWADSTAFQIGSFIRNEKREWEFSPVGLGSKNGLEAFMNMWGIEVE